MVAFVVPFWDPFCALVGLAINPAEIDPTADCVSIERIDDRGMSSFVGEIRLSRKPPKRALCVSDLPFFNVPHTPVFMLRFRAFAGDGELGSQDATFDYFAGRDSDDDLSVTGGLLWPRASYDRPRYFAEADYRQLPLAALRRSRSFLGCRATRGGRIAPATLWDPKSGSGHTVRLLPRRVEESDPIDPQGPRRVREHLDLAIDMDMPLAEPGDFETSIMIGTYNGVISNDPRDLVDLTPALIPQATPDGLTVVLGLGSLVHLSHVFVASLDDVKLRRGGCEGRTLAFLHLGQRYVHDEAMSKAIDRHLDQNHYFRRSLTAGEIDGVTLGPAGSAAVMDLKDALAAASAADGETGDEELLASTLRLTGIDPANVAHLVRHANVIAALQWPDVFARWTACLTAQVHAMAPPETTCELARRILAHEASLGVGRGDCMDWAASPATQLAVWRAFRRDRATVAAVA